MTRRFPRKRPNPVSTIIPRLAMRGDKALAVVERSQSVGFAAMNASQWNEKEFSPHQQHYYLDRPVWLVTILYGRHSAQKPPRAAFRNRGRRRRSVNVAQEVAAEDTDTAIEQKSCSRHSVLATTAHPPQPS